MQQIIDYTKPTGLNSDTDINFIPNGDSPVDVTETNSGRLNVVMEDNHLMTIVNSQGNELETYSLPAGTNKVIGQVEDIENNGLIYFVYNSNSNHSILRYNYDATFTVISTNESIWAFQIDSPIKANIVGSGSDAQLIFTDGVNEVRQFLITKLIAGTYAALDEGKINLIKPPALESSISVVDTVGIQNNIMRNNFQFSVILVYDNNQKSVPGPYLKYDNPILERINGVYGSLQETQNTLRLSFQGIYNNVTSAEIHMRFTDVGGGVPSIWYLYDIIDVSGTSFTYDFNNDKNKYAANQDLFKYLYDDVPISNGIEILNNNRVALSSVTKNYDNITPDVSLSVVKTENVTSLSGVLLTIDQINASATVGLGNLTSIQKGSVDKYHKISIFSAEKGLEELVHNSDINQSTTTELLDYLADFINLYTVYNITAARSTTELDITNNESFAIYVTYKSYEYSGAQTCLGDGATHYFCMFYYDEFGRVSRAQRTTDMSVFVPFQSEYFGALVDDEYKVAQRIQATIVHTPPSWAKYWGFGYGSTDVSNRFQVPAIVKNDVYLNNSSDVSKLGDNTVIRLPRMLSRFFQSGYDVPLNTFSPASGDKIRICGYFEKPVGSTFVQSDVKLIDEYIEATIIGVDLNNNILIKNWDYFENSDILNGEGDPSLILIEFFRIKKEVDEDSLVYKEVGSRYEITGGYHTNTFASALFGISNQDQTGAQDAITEIDFGNVLMRGLEFNELLYPGYTIPNLYDSVFSNIFSENVSLLYPSEGFNEGRINIFDPEYKRRTQKAIMWGGTYAEDGVTFNELNKFKPENIAYLDDKFGDVTSIVQDGYTLNAIQQSKITTLGIGRQETTLADGTSQYLASSVVLGTPNALGEFYGSIFPLSVVKNDRNIYGYDIYSGLAWRKSPNGVEDISRYGMKKWFRNKSQALLDSGLSNVNVLSGWDEIDQMLYMTFSIDASGSGSDNFETIGFHEPTNRWFSFYSFIPELYGRIGNNRFITFKEGSVYKHHSDSADRNEFYGVNYSSKLYVVGNDQPQLTKTFDSIEEDSLDVWTAANSGDVMLSEDYLEWTNPEDFTRHRANMSSRLKSSQFKLWEGMYRASFLKDETTTSTVAKQYDLLNGRALKGKSILMKLSNSSLIKVVLRMLKINSTESK